MKNTAWFGALKASIRNSKFILSVIFVFLLIPMSKLVYAGPVKAFKPIFPTLPGVGLKKTWLKLVAAACVRVSGPTARPLFVGEVTPGSMKYTLPFELILTPVSCWIWNWL